MDRRKVGLLVLLNAVMAVAALLVAEGLASTALVVAEVAATRPVAERVHTEHDTLLGWINLPNVEVRDMYGPGLDLRTNAQRFRGDEPVLPGRRPGSLRVICSGDSFTFGYGVDNDHTWCRLLARGDSRLETVNMAQGGYGFDQIYLWYMRDGAPLEHDVQILALITYDFERMLHDRLDGYRKPRLAVESDRLEMRGVPVPRESGLRTWMSRRAPALQRLALVRAFRKLGGVDASTAAGDTVRGAASDAEVRALPMMVGGMIADLQRANASKGSALVIVYLPTYQDYVGDESDFWRTATRGIARTLDIPFIDLVEAIRALPPEQASAMFIPRGQLKYASAAGHYTREGNAFVASLVHRGLLTIPALVSKLAAMSP